MKLVARYFYESGEEMKQGDLVYLKGREFQRGTDYGGFFKLADISEDILTVYFLGQDIDTFQAIDIVVDTISVLMPIVNYGLIEELEEMKKGILEKIKNRN